MIVSILLEWFHVCLIIYRHRDLPRILSVIIHGSPLASICSQHSFLPEKLLIANAKLWIVVNVAVVIYNMILLRFHVLVLSIALILWELLLSPITKQQEVVACAWEGDHIALIAASKSTIIKQQEVVACAWGGDHIALNNASKSECNKEEAAEVQQQYSFSSFMILSLSNCDITIVKLTCLRLLNLLLDDHLCV